MSDNILKEIYQDVKQIKNHLLGDDEPPDEPEETPEWTNLGRDSDTHTKSGVGGIRLKTKADLSHLTVRLSGDADGLKKAYLTDDSGEVIETQETTDGRLVSFESELDGGEVYRIVADADGSEYTRGRADVGHALPIEGDGYEVTEGVYSGHRLTGSYRYNFDRVRAVSGEPIEPIAPEEPEEPEPEQETVDLGGEDDEPQSGMTNQSGVRFEAHKTFDGLGCRLSSEVGRDRHPVPSQALLKREAGGGELETIEKVSVQHLRAGGTFNFDSRIDEGEAYHVVLWGDGKNYTRGRMNSPEYPYEGEHLTVTEGVFTGGGNTTEGYRYNVSELVTGNFSEGDGNSVGYTDLTPDPAPEQYYNDVPVITVPNREAGETINVVEDSRIDHEGDVASSIYEFLDSQRTIDHEFYFPNGQYLWNKTIQFTDADYLAFRGESKFGVILNNTEQIKTGFRYYGDVDHVEIENLILDIEGTDSSGTPLDAGLYHITAKDHIYISNYRLRGERHYGLPKADSSVSSDMRGNKFTAFANISNPDGEGYIERVEARDGDREYTDNQFDHAIGFSCDPPHEGTILYNKCDIRGHADNGFYLAHAPGEVYLIDSYASNNGGTNIRVGGGEKRHLAVNCKADISNGSQQSNTGTGAWIQHSNAEIRYCEIGAPDGANDMMRANSSTNAAKFVDCTVEVGEDSRCRVIDCTRNSDTNESGVVFEGITVDDRSRSGQFHAIRCTRSDVSMRDCEVNIPGRPTNGLSRINRSNTNINT